MQLLFYYYFLYGFVQVFLIFLQKRRCSLLEFKNLSSRCNLNAFLLALHFTFAKYSNKINA